MKWKARIELRCYADVTVDAEDEETARDFALTAAYETPYPEISEAEVDWIENVPA